MHIGTGPRRAARVAVAFVLLVHERRARLKAYANMKSGDQLDGSPEVKAAPAYEIGEKGGAELTSTDSHTDGVVVEETTQRGLKARHAQMIALGGTIGANFTRQLYGSNC